MAKMNNKSYYGTLATIGIVGGVLALSYVLLKKPKVSKELISEQKEDDVVLSKTYKVKVGLRSVEIEAKPNLIESVKILLPLFVYTVSTSDKLDSDGIPLIEITEKNRINSKLNTISHEL